MKITEKLLTPNSYSRPRKAIREVRAIVLHWYLKPGQSARGAVLHWELRKEGSRGYGSGHYALDDNEVLLAVPTAEVAYHVGSDKYTEFTENFLEGDPNYYTLGVEMAHDDMTGRPSSSVRAKALNVVAMLCELYAVPVNMIVTHFDITGMRPHWKREPCHKHFVTQPGELARFQAEVKERI